MRPEASEKNTIITTDVYIDPKLIDIFSDWQARLNALITTSPGFVSLEILSPIGPSHPTWKIIQRFCDFQSLTAWRESQDRKKLMHELEKILDSEKENILQDMEAEVSEVTSHVTEVFITQVSPDKESTYREWIAKIHQVETKFPGFRGMYMQAPSQNQGRNWITFLHFDTQDNLDRWLLSSERQEVLSEAQPLITGLESHRVISPYVGWFASLAKKKGIPSVWKQTMLVLLALFPIVMLELKYLPLLTSNLNSSLAMFIGNAISVSLIAWPMIPIAIWLLGWWLNPKDEKRSEVTMIGTCLLIVLYIIEIAIFWNFL